MHSFSARAAIGIACVALATPATAQSVEQFYKNNQISFLVGHDAGGGYDLYTRTLVRHMMKHVPGNPTAVVKTMPGAGGIRMINFMYATAPRDGTTFGISDRGYVLEPLLGNKSATFDVAKMSALGSIGKQTPACSLWHGARVKTIHDALTQEAVIGGTGPSATTIYPAILNAVLKTKFKIVAGYRGSGEIMLAIERGEAEGVCLSWDTLKTLKPEWLADGRLKPIVQMGLVRIAELKNLPTAIELAKSDADKKMLTLYFGPNEMGRPYLGPPDVPKDRLQALRRAFDATMKDPAYLAEATSQKMEVDPMTGEEMEKLIKEFYAASPEMLTQLNAILAQNRGRN
jgi:tripartite-type tricarboxylate transporter receptor subunit TctC